MFALAPTDLDWFLNIRRAPVGPKANFRLYAGRPRADFLRHFPLAFEARQMPFCGKICSHRGSSRYTVRTSSGCRKRPVVGSPEAYAPLVAVGKLTDEAIAGREAHSLKDAAEGLR
jgi:hypothetical protein